MSDLRLIVPGEEMRRTLEVRNIDGALADTGSVILRVKPPVGEVQVFDSAAGTVTRDGPGRYHADVLLDASGQWYFRWETGSPLTGALEDSLTVRVSKVLS